MPAQPTCPECGAALAAEAHHGLCPKCLLGASLGTEAVPAPDPTIRLTLPPDDTATDRVGRYKILQKLGEGGCGVVYMAEQQEPVKRRVALKVIKLCMDSRQVIARFEAERQALALMDHSNIAKVLDGGTTQTGQPFFVMELVRGIPITRFCDENRLDTAQRLELFILVCQAVQHAHQKGIIHRDIKPSNILVSDHDGVPVPKVIDFGIAKATAGQTLTDKTLFTAFEQFMGTPAYMSPEQAKLSGLDIDTRSDIYSLGVLLYELLTGKTPFDSKRLIQAGLDEIRRIIQEEDPPRPSTRLSTLEAVEQTTMARQRQIEPLKLAGLVRGDLDWIVMKFLEKDRKRRYETANGLAREIERFLSDEPVVARPPSPVYKIQKFVRRNKLTFAAGCAVAGAMILGLGLSTWCWLEERTARRQAVAAEEQMRTMVKFFRDTQILRTVHPKEHSYVATGSVEKLPGLVPPGDPRLNGKTYTQWAAEWWQRFLQMPMTNSAGAVHPWIDTPRFDVSEAQMSDVWFLAAPFGTAKRSCLIPEGKSLFFPLFCVESSSLEEPPYYGATTDDQSAVAQYWADHIVDPFCELDGIALSNMAPYRIQSPQVSITAPAPWILGQAGGRGTSTGDGYFVFLSPMAPGEHTLHYGAAFRFTKAQDGLDLNDKIDMTYHIKVVDASVAAIPRSGK